MKCVLLTLIAIIFLFGCGTDSPPDSVSGQRILSLSPHATQMLAALGVMDQVVGVTDFCIVPESHADVARVGGLMNPNVELMLSLRPSIVFHAPTARDLEERLRQSGVRVVALPNETLAEIHAGIQKLGEELGATAKAGELVAESLADIEALSVELRDRPRPSVLFVVGHTPGSLRDIIAAGPRTFLDELMGAAGATNRMGGASSRYPQVSREALIREPPDVILMASPPGGWRKDEKEYLRKAWMEMVGPAFASTRVEFIDDPMVTIPGPDVARSARQLARLIHDRHVED